MIVFVLIVLVAIGVTVLRKPITKYINNFVISYRYKKNYNKIFDVENFKNWSKDFSDELSEDLICRYIKSTYRLECSTIQKIDPKIKEKVYIFYKDIKRT